MARISRDEYNRMMRMMGAGSQRISEEEYDYMKDILDGDIPTAPRYTIDDVVGRTNDLINSYSSDVRSGQNFSRVTGSAGGRDVTGEDYYQRRMEGMRRYLDTVLEYAKESNDFDLAGSVLYSRQRLGISDEEPSFEWNDDLYSNSGYILDKLDNASGVQRNRSVEEYKENETDAIDENVAEILDFYAQRPATQSTTRKKLYVDPFYDTYETAKGTKSMPSDTGSTFNEEEYLGRIADNYGASINSAADAAAAYYGYVSSAPPDQLDPEVLKFYLDKMNEAETERNDLRDQSISAERGRARNWFSDNEDYYSGIQNREDFSENIAGWDNEIIPSYANATPEAEAYFGYINTTDPNNRDPRLEAELRRRYEEAARSVVEETRPMTDEQKQIRAYILNTEGEQAAREYDRYLDYQFNAQNAQRVSEAAEQNTDTLAGKIVSTGVSVPANLAGGLLGTIDILAQNARNALGDYRPVDYNSPAQSVGTYAREVRENVTDDIDSNVGKFLYGTGTSMLDSVAALATGNAGGALLGLSAAQNAVYDAVDAGATDTQALGIGLLNGAAEMFFEDISLSNLDAFMTTDARGIKNFVKNILKQSFTEGSEEFFTTVANTLTDALVMQDRSEINRNIETYINNGYDEKDATKMAAMDWFKNASLDMLGGFLSGGILGGAGQAIGNYESNRASGEQVRRSGRIDSLLNYANDFGTERQKRAASQILQNKEKASDAKIGSLYNSFAVQNDQQTSYMDLLDRLEENYQASMALNAQDSAEISAPAPSYDKAEANIPVEAKTPQIEEKQANRAMPESAESVSRETRAAASNLNIKNESGDGISVPAVLNDGTNTTVVGISEAGGDIMLDMADGKTVSPDDVSFNDPSVQRLIDESEKFDAQGATDLLMNYDGTNVDTYIRGYNAAYESGRLGMDYESFTQKRGAASLISEEAARSAFDAGLRMSDMRRSSPNVSGGVVLKTTQNLSAAQRNQIGVIDAFASAIGRTINVVDSISENEASGRIMSIAANAMFDPATNEYTIALDADAEAYIPIAMHESVHDISRNAQKEYATLRDSVFKWLQESGSDIDSIRNDWKERIPDKDDAYYDEEIVANTVPAILKDSATAQEFADRFLDTSEKKNAFVRLIDSIIDFMRNAVAKLRSLKRWDSMRAVENNIQAIKDIREKLFAGYSAIIEKSTQPATQSVSKSEKLESMSESAFGSFDSNNVTSGETDISETRLSPKEEQTTKQTLRENENLRRANEILRAEMKRSKVFGVDRKAMQRIAKEFASEFDIPRGFDSRSFGDTLYRIYNAMINEGMSYDDGVAILQNEVKSLFESMPEKFDSVAYKEDAPIREYLRGQRLNITADVYRDAMTRYTATASEYRGLLRGFGITTSKDGVDIDTFWREASEKFPYIFSEDIISPEQQVETLADILKNSLHKDNYFVDRFEYGIDEAALDAAVTILDKAFMTDPYQTFADKQHAKLKDSVKKAREASKQRYRARIDALKSKYKAEISELKLDVRHGKSEIRSLEKSLTRQSKLYDRLVEKSGKKEAKLMQRIFDTKERYRQKTELQTRKKYADRIYKNADVIFRWLSKPTNTQHVPEKVRNAVISVLNSIRFEGRSIASAKANRWISSLSALSDMLSNRDIDSEIEEFSMYLDPDLPADIRDFISDAKAVSINEMTTDEIKRLSGLIQRIKSAITTINMMHGQESAIYVSDVANETVRDMRKIIAKKGNTPVARAARAALSGVTFLDQLDFYHFSKMLGGGSMRIYNGLRDGFDNYVNMIEEAVSFEKENLSGVDSASISGKNNANIEVETEDGTIKLTRAQIMYLYLLSKRENAKSHLFDGGEGIVSVFDDGQESFRVTEDQVAKAVGKLSEAEKEAAEKMQRFMEVNCANWGNEATLKEYGYKKFGERNYVPMTVKQATVATRRSEERGRSTNLMAIPNRGFTKQVSGEATNALVIDDIFSVFARHVSDMAEYSAYLSPIVDTVKWLNWRGEIDGKRIYLKDEIARAFPGKKSSSGKRGKSQAITYIENFIKNLSRAYSSDLTDTLYSKLIGLGKGAAVGMNLSVAIQQPSSYGRAIGVISAESLTKALARKPSVDIMKRYSPIGLWKSWGFYDRNIGRSIEEIILNRSTLYDSVRDKQMILAEKADEITWGMLWNACEEEIISRGIMSEKDRGTDAFYKEAANLFRVVIDDTQVVDTVFNRAPAQRDSAKLLLTTFQSETMKTYGSMLSALWDTRIHGNKDNRFVRYIAGAAASQIIAAALQAAVGAMRDEDDEKGDDAIEKLLIKLGIIQEYGRYTYGEKYAVRFVENAIDNLNPFRLHWMSSAVVDTIESVFKGFSQSSRIDTKVFEVAGRLITSVKNAIENKSIDDIDKIIFRTAELASYASGVGFANAFRDIKGLYNTLTSALSDPDEHSSVEAGIRAIENGEAGEVDIQLYISNRADEIMKNYPAYTYERAVEEAESDARSAVTRMYKDDYVSAIRSGDTRRANEIVSNMVKTGLYGSGRDAENEARDIAVKWVISSLKSEYLHASSQSQRERIVEQLYSTRYWRSRNELRKAIESWIE